MCYTTWPQEGHGGAAMAKLRRAMLGVNSFRERLYNNPVGHIWMTSDGEPCLLCNKFDLITLQPGPLRAPFWPHLDDH